MSYNPQLELDLVAVTGKPILEGYISNKIGAYEVNAANISAFSGTAARLYIDTYNNSNVFGSSFRGRRFRGTTDSPSGILKDDVFLQLVGDGFDGGGIVTAKVSIFFAANENWASGSGGGTYMAFRTTPSGSLSVQERMRIAHDGRVGIGSNNPSYTLEVSGSGNFVEGVYWNGVAVLTGNYVQNATNLGGGTGLFVAKNGNNLEFKTITGAGTIHITNQSDLLVLSGEAGVGGAAGVSSLNGLVGAINPISHIDTISITNTGNNINFDIKPQNIAVYRNASGQITGVAKNVDFVKIYRNPSDIITGIYYNTYYKKILLDGQNSITGVTVNYI